MTSVELIRKYYPNDSWDGTKVFYQWLRSCIEIYYVALNLGAGPTSRRKIRSLRGEVAKVVGADIDDVVLKNENLDEAVVIRNGILPFEDNTFDIVWSDFVLEHVENPEQFLREIYRVMKPGASFFFRTPNKHHYVSLIARATPHWFHDRVANRVRGLSRDAHEPYPTYFRMNSRKAIYHYARKSGFSQCELRFIECEPSYLVFHALPFLLGVAYERTVNRFDSLAWLRANIFVRFGEVMGRDACRLSRVRRARR